MLARRASQILSQAEQLIAETRGASVIPELRLGIIDSFAGTVGPAIARHLMGRVARLMLWSGLTGRLSEEFLSRNIELVISAEEIRSEEDLRQIPLFWEPFILVAPKSMVRAGAPASLADLARSHPMIRYSARSHTGMQVEQHLRRIRVSPPRHLEMDSSDSLLATVAGGVGWSITTPLCVLHGRPNFARIALLPLPGAAFSRRILLTHRQGEYDDLADSIAELTRGVLLSQVQPEIERWAPWAARTIASRFADDAGLHAGTP
jgi:DNA-binding transcriptional LysR family regulator